MMEPKCTYCGGKVFYEGPSGGAATNVLCANPQCRHWFNLSPFGFDDLHRVEPKEEEQKEREIAWRTAKEEAKLKRRMEGAEAYRNGGKMESLRTDALNFSGAEHPNVDRMVGYIDAMADDLRTYLARLRDAR